MRTISLNLLSVPPAKSVGGDQSVGEGTFNSLLDMQSIGEEGLLALEALQEAQTASTEGAPVLLDLKPEDQANPFAGWVVSQPIDPTLEVQVATPSTGEATVALAMLTNPDQEDYPSDPTSTSGPLLQALDLQLSQIAAVHPTAMPGLEPQNPAGTNAPIVPRSEATPLTLMNPAFLTQGSTMTAQVTQPADSVLTSTVASQAMDMKPLAQELRATRQTRNALRPNPDLQTSLQGQGDDVLLSPESRIANNPADHAPTDPLRWSRPEGTQMPRIDIQVGNNQANADAMGPLVQNALNELAQPQLNDDLPASPMSHRDEESAKHERFTTVEEEPGLQHTAARPKATSTQRRTQEVRPENRDSSLELGKLNVDEEVQMTELEDAQTIELAETPPTPEGLITPPTDLTVEVDDELLVRIQSQGQELAVAMEGQSDVIEDMRTIGPELADSLRDLGFTLSEFSAKAREEGEGLEQSTTQGEQAQGEQDSKPKVRRGLSIDITA